MKKIRAFLITMVMLPIGAFANTEASTDLAEKKELIKELDAVTTLVPMPTRPWRAPQYSKQQSALGYTEDTFKVPAGLEPQVNFWISIYSKYSTQQGVIHDTDNVEMIFEEIDFESINRDITIGDIRKSKLRSQMVDAAKDRAIETIKKISKMTNPEGLNDYEKKAWDYYSKLSNPDKYKDVLQKGKIRFQQGLKDRMKEAIYLSGRYIEEMEQIFTEAGLPIELTRIPFVESSFNVFARSKVGASGLWQIMPYTGRGFIMMNGAIDKRNHPIEATKLAAKLFKFNYNMLNSWPLAVTGYNHGPSGVKKMVNNYQTNNIVELIQNVSSRKSFGFASRNFYATFLAALEVEKNAQKYFPDIAWAPVLDKEDIKITRPLSYKMVLTWFDGEDKIAQTFNPHIMGEARKFRQLLPVGAVISVPRSKIEIAQADMANPKAKPTEYKTTPQVTESKTYVVSSGDNLTSIAKKFGVKMSDILVLNDLDSPSKIRRGQKLKIP